MLGAMAGTMSEIQPAPEITSVETWESWDEAWFPAGPRAFARTARASGWEVRVGFSRGSIPGRSADTWQTRDIIGVWIDGYGRRAAAFWERNPEAEFSQRKLDAGTIKAGEIPSGMIWSTAGTLIFMGFGRAWRYANLTDLEEWIALKGDALRCWYSAIQAWVQAHEERDARKAPAVTKQRDHA